MALSIQREPALAGLLPPKGAFIRWERGMGSFWAISDA
jgi:hypothetical protein